MPPLIEHLQHWSSRWMHREKNRAHAVVWPDRNLVIVILVAGALWYAAASQNSGLAYFLLFWLAALVLVSGVRTRANVGNIVVTLHPSTPVFADENSVLVLDIFNPSRQARYAWKLRIPNMPSAGETFVKRIGPGETTRVEIVLKPLSRGTHRVDTIQVESRFPFQVLVGISWLPTSGTLLIYPRRVGPVPLPEPRVSNMMELGELVTGRGDDFYGLRKYSLGDSSRHIDWKAVARGHPLMVKQFGGSSPREIWLDWRVLEDFGFEARLSQLAKWAWEAEAMGESYGLRLPRTEIEPERGESHLQNCLKTLALFRVDP